MSHEINNSYALQSLQGVWVGDCIGNLGTIYNAPDILRALDEGLNKLSSEEQSQIKKHINFMCNYSDDTEEAIVLTLHLIKNNKILQDQYAKELAERYYTRDPDGEIYGYGLMTRKVLKDIYDGIPWNVANQTKPRIEGPSFVDKMVSNIISGESIKDSMKIVNTEIQKSLLENPELKIGSCGNGSAMRVAPLGAFMFDSLVEDVINEAIKQAEVTHCHMEGKAGSVAIALVAQLFVNYITHIINIKPWDEDDKKMLYDFILEYVPKGKVWDGIKKASELPLDTSLSKLIEILGNGTHVTCQDTVPLCIFLAIKAVLTYDSDIAFEKSIMETCSCYGDTDTNCAIVGGLLGILFPIPTKLKNICQPMDLFTPHNPIQTWR